MKGYLQLAILAGIVMGLPVLASAQSQVTKAQQQEAGEQAPPEGLGEYSPAQLQAQAAGQGTIKTTERAWSNPKEEKAYKAFYNTPAGNPQEVIRSGESFLKSFPNSFYAYAVYARLAHAYEVTGDSQKMFDAGHKALAINPNDVDVLSLMAYTIPRRIDPNNISSGLQLQETTQDANHALDLLSKMQKPPNLTPAQFTTAQNADEAFCHSGLGLVDYYQHDVPAMVTEFEQAVKLEGTPDPADVFLLGVAYLQAGRASDAVTTLQKCANAPGTVAFQCESYLTQAQKLAASPPKQ
jgi:tetratricopeptide (TPR) repeat protein